MRNISSKDSVTEMASVPLETRTHVIGRRSGKLNITFYEDVNFLPQFR